jgi:hypothetical protein
MGNGTTAVAKIRTALNTQDRSFAWLAREAQIPYKRVLSEVKHGIRPITLDTALAASTALGMDLPTLLDAA